MNACRGLARHYGTDASPGSNLDQLTVSIHETRRGIEQVKQARLSISKMKRRQDSEWDLLITLAEFSLFRVGFQFQPGAADSPGRTVNAANQGQIDRGISYKNEIAEEPPCVLGYLQMFVLSNGDVLTGCYPLKPVGNVLRDRLETILASQEYADQCAAMVRRECPGCTCGVESSLAMKHAVSSGLKRQLTTPRSTATREKPTGPSSTWPVERVVA